MSMSPTPSAAWRELLIDTLRLAARVAIKLNEANLADMKTLIGVALYRELRERGETSEAMSLTLDCSLRTVKNLSRHSREADNPIADKSGSLRRVIKRLESGPASRKALSRLLPISLEFDVSRVAFGVLRSEGLVKDVEVGGLPGLALTEIWQQRGDVNWQAPLGEIERLHRVGLSVFAALGTESIGLEALARVPRLRRLPEAMILRALRMLEAEGIAYAVEGVGWRLSGPVQSMETADPRVRWRQGLMYLMERLGLFVDFALSGHHESVVSQHSITFDARPTDLKPFYQGLWKHVIAQLTALDAKAEAEGGGVPCQFIWFASPIGG